MDNRYLQFLKNGSFFYEPQVFKGNEFKLSVTSLNSRWEQHKDDSWAYYLYKANELPNQGWKIHITSTIEQAQDTLDTIVPELISQNISFKYVPSKEALLMKNSKYGDRASSGKFITIYPRTEDEFIILLYKLSKKLELFDKGPYILNDKQWYESNVFFRYGAFKEMYTTIDNKKVLAIKNTKGEYIQDMRVPYYEVPDFITEPIEVQKMTEEQELLYKTIDTSSFDNYSVDSALHFSNAGGVYKVVRDGKTYVMKEGRKESGVDALGRDGFERVKHEYQTLKSLNELPEVVNVYDYFEVWENNYLVEEYIEGRDLSTYVAQDFPFSKFEDRETYFSNIKKIIENLKQAVEKVHSLGYALGDLQPNNVLVMFDNSVRLIDLETTTKEQAKYNPSLQTPGFVLTTASNFEEADWFAFWRVVRFLLLPIEPVSDINSSIEKSQDLSIASYFGENAIDFLESIRAEVEIFVDIYNQGIDNGFSGILMQLNKDNLTELKCKIRKVIENDVDTKRNILIHGDIKQYLAPLGSLNVATGAFGALMALKRTGELTDEVKLWAYKRVSELIRQKEDIQLPFGMFDGISGIAGVLYELDEVELAENLIGTIEIDSLESSDVTLYSGLSGLGLMFLSFYKETGNRQYLSKSVKLAKDIYKHFNSDKAILPNEGEVPFGLISGWSGAALFLCRLAREIDDSNMLSHGMDILQYELKNNVEIDESLEIAQVKDFSLGKERLIPYLGEGAAGIFLVLLEFNKELNLLEDPELKKILKFLSNVDQTYCTYSASLTKGMAGLLILSNAKSNFYADKDIDISVLRNYLFQMDDAIFVPGDYGYRFSMDLFTGASGVLLALEDIGTSRWNSWLPIINNNLSILS